MKMILITLFVLLSGFTCEKKVYLDEKDRVRTYNSDEEFQITKLFEHEGCKVYHFKHGGVHRYFTDCKGSTQWTTSRQCGKTRCYDQHQVTGGK